MIDYLDGCYYRPGFCHAVRNHCGLYNCNCSYEASHHNWKSGGGGGGGGGGGVDHATPRLCAGFGFFLYAIAEVGLHISVSLSQYYLWTYAGLVGWCDGPG